MEEKWGGKRGGKIEKIGNGGEKIEKWGYEKGVNW